MVTSKQNKTGKKLIALDYNNKINSLSLVDTVLKSLNKNRFNTKSRDFLSALFNGQASKPYIRTGTHLELTRCRTTSSDANLPILP